MALSDLQASKLAEGLRDQLDADPSLYVGIAPSFTALAEVNRIIEGTALVLGAQNVCWEKSGAYTGEISADTIKQLGCSFVIVGHSERRRQMGESEQLAAKRAKQALVSGLLTVFCIGESDAERTANQTNQVLMSQIKALSAEIDQELTKHLVIAYEPVWAIGTGRVASVEDIIQSHSFILECLLSELGSVCPVLYGGSVTPDNFSAIIAAAHVDGALVGGASLDAQRFYKLCQIAQNKVN